MTTVLDVKGLSCPLPLLRTKKALDGLPAGATLEVHVTDPGAPNDFLAFCEASGNSLANLVEVAGVFQFTIVKTAALKAA